MDLYGHNPFRYRNPDLRNPPSKQGLVDFSDLGRFDKEIQRGSAARCSKRIKLFLSEFTVADGAGQGVQLLGPQATQARGSRTRSGSRGGRRTSSRLGWVHLYDDPPVAGQQVIERRADRADGKKKPGYYAFRRGGSSAVVSSTSR